MRCQYVKIIFAIRFVIVLAWRVPCQILKISLKNANKRLTLPGHSPYSPRGIDESSGLAVEKSFEFQRFNCSKRSSIIPPRYGRSHAEDRAAKGKSVTGSTDLLQKARQSL